MAFSPIPLTTSCRGIGSRPASSHIFVFFPRRAAGLPKQAQDLSVECLSEEWGRGISRNERPAANGQFPFAQGIEQAQLFRHGPRRQAAAQGAFAFKNLLQVKAHGVSRRNCPSNNSFRIARQARRGTRAPMLNRLAIQRKAMVMQLFASQSPVFLCALIISARKSGLFCGNGGRPSLLSAFFSAWAGVWGRDVLRLFA